MAKPVTDEKLIKIANHAGRNLSVLAVLATFGTLACLTGLIFMIKSKAPQLFAMPVLTVAIGLIAAGYWVLAVAAKRGDPVSVGIVIVVMCIQMTLGFVGTAMGAARGASTSGNNTTSFILPMIVLVVLIGNRKNLLALKERGLWAGVFPSAPTRTLCVVGGLLLATGFVTLNAGTIYIGIQAGRETAKEQAVARQLVQIIQNDEAAFMEALAGTAQGREKADHKAASEIIRGIRSKVEVLKSEAMNMAPLLNIVTTYANAARQWENALLLMQDKTGDADRAQKMLELGDKLRAQAGEEFDKRYAQPKAR